MTKEDFLIILVQYKIMLTGMADFIINSVLIAPLRWITEMKSVLCIKKYEKGQINENNIFEAERC